MGEWQLIDSAPKDGTHIAMLCAWEAPLVAVIGFWRGAWLVAWDESNFDDGFEATHWMPLPDPPARVSGEPE